MRVACAVLVAVAAASAGASAQSPRSNIPVTEQQEVVDPRLLMKTVVSLRAKVTSLTAELDEAKTREEVMQQEFSATLKRQLDAAEARVTSVDEWWRQNGHLYLGAK